MEENQKYFFMEESLKLAKKAYAINEVPIGVIIVCNGKILARTYNKRNFLKSAIAHAEILAIEKVCKKINDWRLNDCEMFVTLLPCPMCAGAIINARIKKVYFGAENGNREIFEKIMKESDLNHKTDFEGGILGERCGQLLKDYFKNKR